MGLGVQNVPDNALKIDFKKRFPIKYPNQTCHWGGAHYRNKNVFLQKYLVLTKIQKIDIVHDTKKKCIQTKILQMFGKIVDDKEVEFCE